MNFIFEWQEQYILFLPLEHKIHIFELTGYVLFIIQTHRWRRRFPTTFRRFPMILQKVFQDHANVVEHFPNISENFLRFSMITEDFRGSREDISIIQQRIQGQFKRQTLISVRSSISIEKFTAWRVNSTLNFTRKTDIARIAKRWVRYRMCQCLYLYFFLVFFDIILSLKEAS